MVMFSPTEGLASTKQPDGMIYTVDGGTTWQRVPNAPAAVRDVQCRGGSVCMVLDLLNRVFFSTDGGNSWQQQTVPVDKPSFYDGRDDVEDLQLRSPSSAYIFGIDTHLPPSGQEEITQPDGTRITPQYLSTSFLIKYDGTAWTRVNYDYITSLGIGQFVDDLNG
jgi:hypothetical protein